MASEDKECKCIKEGQHLPHGVLQYIDDQEQLKDVTTEHVFGGKRSILLGLNSLTGPGCDFLDGYVANWDELKNAGISQVVATGVEDAILLKQFRNNLNAPDNFWFKSDARGEFVKSLGLNGKFFGMIVDENLACRWLSCDDLKVSTMLTQWNRIFGSEMKEKHHGRHRKGEHHNRAEVQDHDKEELMAGHTPIPTAGEQPGASAGAAPAASGEHIGKHKHAEHPSRAEIQDHDKLELMVGHSPSPAPSLQAQP